MLNTNVPMTKLLPVVGVIKSQAAAEGTLTSGWIDMSVISAILADLNVGTLGTACNVTAKLEQATDSSGTGAKDVTGKAITTLNDASAGDDDSICRINCRAEELDIANSFRYVRLSITMDDTTSPQTATTPLGAIIYGVGERYQPVDEIAAVQETVY